MLVAMFCALIALLTRQIWPRLGYGAHLVQSLTIGLSIWLVIEAGVRLVGIQHSHIYGDEGSGRWPTGWRGLLVVAVGIACGLLLGYPLGAWLTGIEQLSSARDHRLGMLITAAAGSAYAYYFYLRGKTQALLAAKMGAERDASQARMRLLQSQLEPHMLFNTLANLRALIGVDPSAAQQMLDRLNDYLRATLEANRSIAHPLSVEFDRLNDYLALMTIRMGARLQVALDLPNELRELSVPPLILQPLIENAIQHGLEPRIQGGRIEVRAARVGAALHLTVADSGVGFNPAALPAGRFGMAQVRERVASTYGGRGRLDVQSAPGAGTTVTLVLPLHEF